MDKLISFIAQPDFVVIAILVFMIWKVSKWKTGVDRRLGNLEQRLEDIFSEVMGHIRNIKGDIHEMRDIRPPQNQQPYSESNSPKTLTRHGRELAERMDASSLAERYIDELVKQASEEAMSPYQIQRLCADFAYDKVRKDLRENDKEQYRKLEDAAYNSGVRLSDLMHVLALVLRDRVLEALKE